MTILPSTLPAPWTAQCFLPLLIRFAQSDSPLSWSDLIPSGDPAFLEAAGLIHRLPNRRSLLCECGSPIPARVIESADGTFLRFCSQCGLEPISSQSLHLWRIDRARLLETLARFLSLSPPEEELPEIAWSLGRRGAVPVVFLRLRGDARAENLLRRIYARSIHTYFLTASNAEEILCRRIFPNNPLLSLERFWSDGESTRLSLPSVGLDEKKKPRAKRSERLAKIEKLQSALTLYIRSMNDLIRQNEEAGVLCDLPKRPTQRQLAQRLGMTQPDISNCLRDPQGGKMVRLLWNKMTTLEGIVSLRRYIEK